MKIIHNFLAVSVLIIGMYTVQVFAEEPQKSSNQIAAKFEIQMLDKKLITIQAQIDELNKKLDTASDSEIDKIFVKIDKLEQEKNTILIASKDAEIKEENIKQAKEKEKQAMYDKLIGTVGSIKEALK